MDPSAYEADIALVMPTWKPKRVQAAARLFSAAVRQTATAAIPQDLDLAQVAEALGMSERWVRQRCIEGADHLRYGHKIRFTQAQVDALRKSHEAPRIRQSITTGPRRKRRP